MRLLLDTHALIWALDDPAKLSAQAQAALEDGGNEVLVSAASAWEVATKYRRGKLPNAAALAHDFDRVVLGAAFTPLPISTRHGQLAGALVGEHRDPFDRILAAQAISEPAWLVSLDPAMDEFGIQRLW